MSEANPEQQAERFWTVSMTDNAVSLGEKAWRGRFTEEEVAAWHLDVRKVANVSETSAENMRRARDVAFRFLEERDLRGFQGKLELFPQAKLSFMIWLGWQMRYARNITALNFHRDSGTFQRFQQQKGLTFGNREEWPRLELETPPLPATGAKASNGDCILIVDVLGRSTVAQTDAFFEKPGRPPVQASDAYRLFHRRDGALQPNDLEPLLQDAIEALGVIRRTRRVKRLHLGFSGPAVVAFFLGQQLNAQGIEILLYDFFSEKGGQYRFVFPLERNLP